MPWRIPCRASINPAPGTDQPRTEGVSACRWKVPRLAYPPWCRLPCFSTLKAAICGDTSTPISFPATSERVPMVDPHFPSRRRLFYAVSMGILFSVAPLAFGGEFSHHEIYRRGYPRAVTLREAVQDYNAAHREDEIARLHPALSTREIQPAVLAALRSTSDRDKRKQERFKAILSSIEREQLPKGALLSFQYGEKNRTVYWHGLQQQRAKNNFSIILWSGLDENPPGDGEFDDRAYIVSIPIRCQLRQSPRSQSPTAPNSR